MGQEFIAIASRASAVVILTGVLVLALLRPRPASRVRSLSLATLVTALMAAASYSIWLVFLIGCPPYGDFCGLQYAIVSVIAAYLLFVASVGLCLLTAVVAIVPLARARRWGKLPLVCALGVLPLAYLVVIREFSAVGGVIHFPAIANSLPLTAVFSLLPILIYGNFLYALPRELDGPITWTNPSM